MKIGDKIFNMVFFEFICMLYTVILQIQIKNYMSIDSKVKILLMMVNIAYLDNKNINT